MSQPVSDDFLRELTAIFVAEAGERLQATNRHLLALERSGDQDRKHRLAEILREMHTLKGAAAQVGLDVVKTLSHALEGFFTRILEGSLQPDAESFDAAYRALDAVGSLVKGAAVGTLPEIDLEGLCRALGAPLEPEPPADRPPTTPDAELPPTFDVEAEPGREAVAAPAPGPAAAGSQPRPESDTPPVGTEESVRVSTAKLDALMAQVGELLISHIAGEQRLRQVRDLAGDLADWEAEWRRLRPKYRKLLRQADASGAAIRGDSLAKLRLEMAFLEPLLQENEERVHTLHTRVEDLLRGYEADGRRMGHVTSDLQDSVRRTRMLPVSRVLDAFPRVVRDLSRELGKDAALFIEGATTEVDRSVLEELRAPLSHLIRNAVDHGIETPDARVAAGKPREGWVKVSATQRGGNLVLEVADDGPGIDVDRVKASAVERGLLTPEAAEALTAREAIRLIFRPGVSSSSVVTEISGRGVGMDVVRETVERLRGMIDVETEPGAGTRFVLTLPLTVATTHCLVVRVGRRAFALPITNVVRIQRLDIAELGTIRGRRVARMNEGTVVVTHLADALGLPAADKEAAATSDGRHPAVVLGSAERRAGFLVDELLGSQDMVVKNLPWPLVRVRGAAGATLLGTGEIVLVLNVPDLIAAAERAEVATPAVTAAETAGQALPATVMVVDDSIVTRTLEKSILEAAGYRVRVAADGAEAWTQLKAGGCDLVVSDIKMPSMDGFELTRMVRGDERLKELPVILVTSLDSEDDHERGVEAGADAYIVKSSFTRDRLLETVRQLI